MPDARGRAAALSLGVALALTSACVREADPLDPPAQASDSSIADDHPDGTVDGAAIDAASPADAQQDADSTSSAQCEPDPERYELFVIDSSGPNTLLANFSNSPVMREFSGTVTQQAAGFPSDGLPADIRPPEHPEQFRFLRIRASEHTWTIALRNVPSFGVRDGDAVAVQLRNQYGGFSPTLTSLSIRVGGQLSFLYALGGDVASLMVPSELTVEQGPALCTMRDECGAWSVYALRVRESTSGAAVSLEPDGMAQVGAFNVIHGGDSQQLMDTIGCFDWFVSSSLLVAYRREPVPSPARCTTAQASTLPGVRIEFPDDVPCRFSLSQAAAGIEIPYAVVVETDVAALTRAETPISICTPRDALPADLFTSEELAGNGQLYVLRDQGLCPARTLPPITLRAGRYPRKFRWDGVNWTGPSDTSVPKGPPFPAGTYSLKIQAAGSAPKTSGSPAQDFELKASLELTLTP